MDYPLSVLIGSIVGLIFLSAFFSGSETSLTSASKSRMHTLARSGKKNAGIFEKIFKDKEQLICTILFANNLVNVLASALATKILIEITDTEGIFYATIIMTLMILIFGELIPKTLALSNADKFALKIAPIFKVIILILYPLTKVLNFFVGFILKMLGVDYKDSSKEEILEKSEEELRGAIDLHGKDSTGKEGKQMLKSILDLDDITVGSTNLTFTQFSGSGQITAGTGMTLQVKVETVGGVQKVTAVQILNAVKDYDFGNVLKIPATNFQAGKTGFVELVLNGGTAGGGNNQDITPVGGMFSGNPSGAQLSSVAALDVLTVQNAKKMLTAVDGALVRVDLERSDLGATMSRMEHVINNLSNIVKNTQEARSRIQDADIAAETTNLTKAQVLNQAAQAMLAQANRTSQSILSLLQN